MSPKRASAPKGKGKQVEADGSAPTMLGISRFRSEEAIAKVRGLVADASNEWGSTDV